MTSSPPSTRPKPRPDREEEIVPGLLRGIARTVAIAGTATAGIEPGQPAPVQPVVPAGAVAVLPGARAASCTARGASASAAGSRPHHPAQATGRAESAGSADRRGVRLGEGPDPRPVARGHRADRHTAFIFTWVNRPAREHRSRLAKDDLRMDGGLAICEVSRFDTGCVAPRCLVRWSVREWDGGDDG